MSRFSIKRGFACQDVNAAPQQREQRDWKPVRESEGCESLGDDMLQVFFFFLCMCWLAIDVITFEGRGSGTGLDKNTKYLKAAELIASPLLEARTSHFLWFCFVLHATADVSRALISFFVKGLGTWQHCIPLRTCAHLRMKVQHVIYHVQCLLGFAMHTWICCSGWSPFVVVLFLQPWPCNWSVCLLIFFL